MIFDERQDMRPVFEAALAESRRTGRKVLVEYGGDWCPWSLRMSAVLQRPAFSQLLRQRFIFVRCYVGPDGHSSPPEVDFPSELDSVPFFALMDADGRIVATQRTAGFEVLWFYWTPRIRSFLEGWAGLPAR
jgi:hypothetical protein